MLARGASRGEVADARLLPPPWVLAGAGLAHVARAAAALGGGGDDDDDAMAAAARCLTDPRGMRGWGPYSVARFLEELRDDGLGPAADRCRRRHFPGRPSSALSAAFQTASCAGDSPASPPHRARPCLPPGFP